MRRAPSTEQGSYTGEDYFRNLCAQMGMALIAADRELRIRTWNTAAGRIFGASAEGVMGTPVTTIIPHDRRTAAERMFRRAVEDGEPSELEFQHRDSQGETRELSGTIAPVMSHSGERIGASICVRDITRRIHLQAELHESQKMVALGQMAGAIAHHFNNILGGVVTSIDYAAASTDPEVVKRVLGQTSRALLRASALVNGLLAFAQGDPHTDDLSDVTELLNDLADDVEPAIKGRGIDFQLHLPKLPVVPVPRAQLTTILRNIIQNSVEAMPHGGTLRIDVALTDASVRIVVSDTGRGLSKEELPRIFEPFWTTKQADIAGTGAFSGLGLAVAHGLAQVIGATVTVTSEPGKGSSLTVTVPRATE